MIRLGPTTMVLLCVLSGCMPKMDVESLKQMQPTRPAELEQLAPFIGKWEGTGEIKIAMLEQPLTAKGMTQTSWDCDGWCMLEQDEYELGELGNIKELRVWTWDERAKRFHIHGADSAGGIGAGTVTFDEKSASWRFKWLRRTPLGDIRSRGKMKMTNEDTIDWTWEDWPAWDVIGLFKVAHMQGTNRRR